MRSICLALLIIGVAIAATEAKATKTKRLLNTNNLLGGLLNTDQGLLSSLLGENGITGNLSGGNNLLGLGNTLNNVLGSVTSVLENLVSKVLAVVQNLTSGLTNALQGVDLNDASEVLSAFDRVPCNQLCVACEVVPQNSIKQACMEYCTSTCRWIF